MSYENCLNIYLLNPVLFEGTVSKDNSESDKPSKLKRLNKLMEIGKGYSGKTPVKYFHSLIVEARQPSGT